MRRLIIGLAVLLAALPAIAAVSAAPQPAMAFGVPAMLAMLLVSAIALLLQRRQT